MSSNPADRSDGRAPRTPHSITVHLAVLYAVSAFVVLLATTASLNWILISNIEQVDYYFMVDKAHRLEWTLQRHADDPSFLEREVRWEGGPGQLNRSHTFYSRILDGQERLVIETTGMETLVPGARFPPPVSLELMSNPAELPRWRSPEGRIYCVLSVRARNAQTGQSWVIQVAMDDVEEQATIDKLRRGSLVVLLLGTLVSAGIGALVARRGLKPLRDIAAAAERISVSRLDERIDVARQPEELAALATALNRMLGRLEDSFVRMSQFAAEVAHELRTPIHNMKGEAEVALSVERKPEEYRWILESSLEEFDRLSRMINEMLFIARAENPRERIEWVRFDARREIDAVVEFFEALSESRGVTVTAQGQGAIDADPLLFRRAVTNLLSNALRHTSSGGRIVLSVEQAEDRAILVKVSDSGCGIRPEHLPRICDRLYCADRTNAQSSEQNGLGLSIVKSIVELHGGSIAIDSVLGKGTTVFLGFPPRAPDAAQFGHVSAPGFPAAAPPQSPPPRPHTRAGGRASSLPSGLQKK